MQLVLAMHGGVGLLAARQQEPGARRRTQTPHTDAAHGSPCQCSAETTTTIGMKSLSTKRPMGTAASGAAACCLAEPHRAWTREPPVYRHVPRQVSGLEPKKRALTRGRQKNRLLFLRCDRGMWPPHPPTSPASHTKARRARNPFRTRYTIDCHRYEGSQRTRGPR